MHRRHWKVVMIVALVAASGCDCTERARSLMYGGEDGAVTPTSQRGDEDSRQWEVEPNDRPEDATSIEVTTEMAPMYAEIEPADDVDWFSLELDDDEPWMVELIVEPQHEALDVELYLEVPGGGDYAPLVYNMASAGEAESIPMLKIGPDSARRFFVTGDGESTGEYRIEVRRQLSAATVAMAPNDYAHLAQTLEVPGEIQGFYDRPGDRDVFYVPAESLQAGVYSLELSAVSGLSQMLEIYGDESLDTPLMRIPVSESRPAVIPNLSLGSERGGGLYFVLSADDAYDREQTYRLRLIEHPDSDDFVVEREPNDTREAAQVVDYDVPVRGYLHTPDDVDRFRIVVEEPEADDEQEEDEQEEDDELAGFSEPVRQLIEDEGLDPDELPEIVDPWEAVEQKEAPEHVVQVRLMPLGDAHRLGMRWIPEEGDEREFRADDSEEGLVLCNETVGPGEYDVEVRSLATDEGFRPRSFDYELEVVNVARQDDLEIEPNDEVEQADRLPVGEGRTGFIAREGDVDYYAFIIGPDEPYVVDEESDEEVDDESEDEPADPWAAPETSSVEIRLEGNRLDLGFELLDDEGGRVANVNQRGPGADEHIEIDLPHGLYYVAVSATSGAVCDPYRIEVTAP